MVSPDHTSLFAQFAPPVSRRSLADALAEERRFPASRTEVVEMKSPFRRVVVKFAENLPNDTFPDLDELENRTIEAVFEAIGAPLDDDQRLQIPEFARIIPLTHLYNCIPKDRLELLRGRAQAQEEILQSEYETPDLVRFISLEVVPPSPAATLVLTDFFREREGIVEFAYSESPPTPPPGGVRNYAALQGYHDPAPGGIDTNHAWGHAGGMGADTTFIDLEQGWDLTHVELPALDAADIVGDNRAFHAHGTAVRGVVLASHDPPAQGVLGIAPETNAPWVVSEWLNPGDALPNRACAILRAINRLMEEAGDPEGGLSGTVLLLESQVEDSQSRSLPVETEQAAYTAIRMGTALGITIVEAAANGYGIGECGVDLDTVYGWANGQRQLSFGGDSRAIIVGAATNEAPHRRRMDCNYGRCAVDCYAWGQSIPTTIPVDDYTKFFEQTSGASAIIAGAALVLQGIAHNLPNIGRFLTPLELRGLLTDRCLNTPVCEPLDPGPCAGTPASNLTCVHECDDASETCGTSGRAGVMPDLARIIERLTSW
jgi:hypothetical protein